MECEFGPDELEEGLQLKNYKIEHLFDQQFGFPTRSDTIPAVQSQKQARRLKFWI